MTINIVAGRDESVTKITYHFDSENVIFFRETTDTRSADVRSRSWLMDALNNCAQLNAEKIIRTNRACRNFVVNFRKGTLRKDRVYPPITNFANGGVLLHTRYIAVAYSGRNKSVKFERPKGWVVIANHKIYRAPVVDIPLQEIGDSFVYVGPLLFKAESGMPLVIFDTSVPASLSVLMSRAIATLWSYQRKNLGSNNVRAPIFVVSAEKHEDPGFHGDVSSGIVRMTFFGSQWQSIAKGDALADSALLFVAHELVHVFQPPQLQNVDETGSWLNEGNAEFLALLSVQGTGLLSMDAIAKEWMSRANTCIIDSDQLAWKDIRTRSGGKLPYACGLVQHMLIQHAFGEANPFAIWRSYFATAAALDERSLLAFFSRRNRVAAVVLAQWAEQSYPYADVFKTNFISAEFSTADDETVGGLSVAISQGAFRKLMQRDCDGAFGFWHRGDQIETENVASCALVADKVITGHAGVGVSKGWQFARSLSLACKTHGHANLELIGGVLLEVPCQGVQFTLPVHSMTSIHEWLKSFSLPSQSKR